MKGHSSKNDVRMFAEHFDDNVRTLYDAYKNNTWRERLSYRAMVKTNSNGKRRNILSPSFETRVYQWLSLNMLRPLYERKDNNIALNCKDGRGIQGARPKRTHGMVSEHWTKHKQRQARRNAVVRRIKHIYYDRRDYDYCVLIDQRKCYDHITEKVYRKALKNITTDKDFIEFSIGVTFVKGIFPVGTPTSPTAHHIIMLPFDLWLQKECPDAVRYADNIFAPTRTKEEAHTLMWRIQNVWWYTLGIRAKRHEIAIRPLGVPTDFCGYVFHRHEGKGVCDHDKGYTSVRKDICTNAARTDNDKSWASYFGLLQHADTFALMRRIEKEMKLSQLTEKIRIDRNLDAKNIDIKTIVGRTISIRDYDIRKDAKGNPNWIKCLIGIEETENGEPTGRIAAYEFHGGFQYIIEFITACEKAFTKEGILPLEDVVIENQCGYIFKDSTNQLKYFSA